MDPCLILFFKVIKSLSMVGTVFTCRGLPCTCKTFFLHRVHQSILKKKFSTVAHIQNQYNIMTNVKDQISCQIDLFIDNNLLMYPSMHRRSSKLVLIAAVAYLVVFFALASGLFNSIIEGSRRGTSSFIL